MILSFHPIGNKIWNACSFQNLEYAVASLAEGWVFKILETIIKLQV